MSCWTNSRLVGDMGRHDVQLTSLYWPVLRNPMFIPINPYLYLPEYSDAEDGMAERTGWLGVGNCDIANGHSLF